ncbi:MAG: SulP family inorganic anion transporter [Collimonas sp.]
MSAVPSQHADLNPPPRAKRAYLADLVAGLSIAGLLLPEAVAYSSIANLPPQTGVIALFAGLLCYGLFGSSRFAIVSATSSSAAVLAAATASMANGDAGLKMTLAIGLVMITGLFFLLAGLARMGSATDFIAKPVLRGFAFGLAIVIILKQFAGVAGAHPEHSDMTRFIPETVAQIGHWNWTSVAVMAVALVLLYLFARLRRVPGALLVIVIGVGAGQWLHLTQYGVGLVGSIHLQLATPTLPMLSRAEWLRLGELGFAMGMILYAESYGSIRSFAIKHGDQVAPNRDLLALGASNLLSGLFHGMPVGAGYSATSANEAAGATSRLSGWVAALVMLAIVLTLLPAIALTPEPVLAAIVIHAVGHTLNPAIFRPYFRWRRDRLVVVASVIAVLLLGVLDGLLASIAISLLMMLRQFSQSTISVLGRLGQGHDYVNIRTHPEAKAIPGIMILRPNEPLFFANAERILGQARQNILAAPPPVHTVILSLEESPDLDSSSLEGLHDFFEFAGGRGLRLLLARLKDPVYDILKSAVAPCFPAESLSALSVAEAVHLALAPAGPQTTEQTTVTRTGE